MHKYHKWWSQLIWPFYGLLQLYELKLKNPHISVNSVHKYHKIVLSAFLTVLLVLTTVWAKTSKISYLREFSERLSQIVFSSHLTVLRLITTVWFKTSKISYLREFSAQISQIVFSAYLNFLQLNTTVWDNLQKLHIFLSSVHKYHKSCF